MENKKEYCEKLLKDYKDSIPRIPKVSEGSRTPEIHSTRKERSVLLEKLKKECWEFLSNYNRPRIEKEYCENLIRRWKELKTKLPRAQDPRKPIEPSYITPDEMRELDKTTEELKKDCLGYLSPEDQWEVKND